MLSRYSTVGFGTWPAQGRNRRPGPPEAVQFSTGSYGIYAEPGNVIFLVLRMSETIKSFVKI